MSETINILHVEDDFADAMLFQHAVCDAGAFHLDIVVVRTMVDAKYKLQDKAFDLIVADMLLPDSREPLETIKTLQKYANGVPIVALTGSSIRDELTRVPGVGVLDKNQYFRKPDEAKAKALLDHVLAPLSSDNDVLMI